MKHFMLKERDHFNHLHIEDADERFVVILKWELPKLIKELKKAHKKYRKELWDAGNHCIIV